MNNQAISTLVLFPSRAEVCQLVCVPIRVIQPQAAESATKDFINFDKAAPVQGRLRVCQANVHGNSSCQDEK
jgi:hypothetical protein